MKNYIDIHCHSVMTHYRNQHRPETACKELVIEGLTFNESIRSINTQSNFGKLVAGKIGAIFISLYPIERKWLFPDRRRISGLIGLAVNSVTGFSKENIKQMHDEIDTGNIDYYKDLYGEYSYLKTQVNRNCKSTEVKIASNYEEYLANKNSGTISVILSVEGAHSLGKIKHEDLKLKPKKASKAIYDEKYKNSVFAMKNWGKNGSHTPFYITLSHHFWNMIAGHCESVPSIFAQKKGKNYGLTEAGKMMINDLLSTKDIYGEPNKTRKVLIDIKHMSPRSRSEFYNKLKEDGISIPIICSHASIGDTEKLESYYRKPKYKGRSYFNSSSLSLTAEDIKAIVNSDGIIGIILHEKRISHKKAKKNKPHDIKSYRNGIEIKEMEIEKLQLLLKENIMESLKEKYQKEIQVLQDEINSLKVKIKEGFVLLVLANIYRIVEVSKTIYTDDQAKSWNHISIGSDFDGLINKLDYLGTSKDFPDLEKLLIKFLKKPVALNGFSLNWTRSNLKALQFGIAPEVLAQKIMGGNAEEFLRKYFNEEYLKKDVFKNAKKEQNLIAFDKKKIQSNY